ncbi:2'-5' RNA ligase family protein [Streptacidiphilus sp. MAP5-3]|uniref:2'-5' RNA ligase family protein n=1 Tax=Streptacidiphilus sp. MAP5-3 TaxID=3156265 RepID=UPI003517E51D
MDSFFNTVTHRWPEGREDYHWHILPPAGIRNALFESYKNLTLRENLAPVQPEWYHVTLLHSGPVSEITDDEIAAITEQVRKQCATIAPFDLTLDRPSVGTVALECAGRPGEPARRLWEITAKATAAVTGERFPLIPPVYYPHASIAYATGPVPDRRDMKAWLSDCPTQPVTFTAENISLVAQSHDGREITWRHVASVPLGTAS